MWSKGIVEVPEGIRVSYTVKHYGMGSNYGINGGKISKLSIKANGKSLANYDRGWDHAPDKSDAVAMTAYREILKKYN